MRVSRNQIVEGVIDYIQSDVLPKMDNDKAVQIVLAIVLNSVTGNSKLVDGIFKNEIIRTMLGDDGTGTYDITTLFNSMQEAVDMYGSFPVSIPAIPLVSPREITLKLNADDIEMMRHRIEGDI